MKFLVSLRVTRIVLAAGALGLGACGDDPFFGTQIPCTTATAVSSCGGNACVVASGAETGVCSSSPATDGCAAGFGETTVDGVTRCTPIGGEFTCADVDCGDLACDESSGTPTCVAVGGGNACTPETVEDDCAEDEQCDVIGGEGTCNPASVEERSYQWIAVYSYTTDPEALDNVNPGPDIDAISITVNGTEVMPVEVVASSQGPGNEDNTRPLITHADAVLAHDTLGSSSADCDLDLVPGYVSIGGTGGYVIVGFASPFPEGAVIEVTELNSATCDLASERLDNYAVFAGRPMIPASASELESTWCLIGLSSETGGTVAGTFNDELCQ